MAFTEKNPEGGPSGFVELLHSDWAAGVLGGWGAAPAVAEITTRSCNIKVRVVALSGIADTIFCDLALM